MRKEQVFSKVERIHSKGKYLEKQRQSEECNRISKGIQKGIQTKGRKKKQQENKEERKVFS